MKANKSSTAMLLALLAVAWRWLCGEASAMFTGYDDSSDEPAAVDGTGSESRTRDDAGRGTGSGSGEVIVNPFNAGPRSTMPEDEPGAALRRSSSWTDRRTNARRFERLLRGGLPPTAEAGPVAEEDTPPERPNRGLSGLDYVVGVLVAAGLGVIALMLFRRHGSS